MIGVLLILKYYWLFTDIFFLKEDFYEKDFGQFYLPRKMKTHICQFVHRTSENLECKIIKFQCIRFMQLK